MFVVCTCVCLASRTLHLTATHGSPTQVGRVVSKDTHHEQIVHIVSMPGNGESTDFYCPQSSQSGYK